ELADACIRFVDRALGVRLDYSLETLPLLDHYLEQAREAACTKPETSGLVAQAAGAYFGELLRRRYASWWGADDADPSLWQIELENVYLAVAPVALVSDLLHRGTIEEGDVAFLELLEDDRAAVAARLADLPGVSDAEYYSLATRLEVIDIAVEAIR